MGRDAPILQASHGELASWMSWQNGHLALVMVLCIALTTLMHYEGLRQINLRMIRRKRRATHHGMLYACYFILLLHLTEILVFALAYFYLQQVPGMGYIHGAQPRFFDSYYFSAMVFSSVGLGDLYPSGLLRLVVGVEGLLGLMLIGWSASFTYLEMQTFWPHGVQNPSVEGSAEDDDPK